MRRRRGEETGSELRKPALTQTPEFLPVRVTQPGIVRVELEVGGVVVRLIDGGEPAYVAEILFWDRGGVERGTFRLPRRAPDGRSVEMDATELAMLLDGLDFGGSDWPKARGTPDGRSSAASCS